MGERVQAGAAVLGMPGVGRAPRPPGRPAPRTGPGESHPELDCVRDRLSVETLRRADMRAERLGTGADRALVANGTMDEET